MKGLTFRPLADRRPFPLLGLPASLVTTPGAALSTAPLRAGAHPQRHLASREEKGAASRHLWVLPSPRSGYVAGRGHNHRGFAKRHPDARPNHPPRRRAGCGRSSRESQPRLSLADSRCNPSASAPGSRTSCVKNRWRPVSSGFPPSLVFPRGPALGDGDLEGTGRWPPLDRRATRRAGGYLPEGLRVRPMFPSPPSGLTGQGLGSRGEVPWATASAPHPLPGAVSWLPRGPPRAPALNTRAIIKQTLTWAGGC